MNVATGRLLLALAVFPCAGFEVTTTLKNYEPLFENEQVRVGRVTLQRGESEGLHRHAYPRVLVALESGVITVKKRDGSVETTSYSPGMSRFQDNTDPHEPVNTGNTRFRAVVVELKKHPSVQQTSRPDPLDPLLAAAAFHAMVIDNDMVRVLEVRNRPGDFEPMHKHRRSVIIILEGGAARFGLPDGRTRDATFSPDPQPGQPPQVFWEDAETHSVLNTGNTPVRPIRVELK